MLINKLFQVRDAGTNMSVLVIEVDISKVTGRDNIILKHAGYGTNSLYIFIPLVDSLMHSSYDPYCHSNRTRIIAHQYIADNWAELRSGDVIDVEFILGISPEIKKFEH